MDSSPDEPSRTEGRMIILTHTVLEAQFSNLYIHICVCVHCINECISVCLCLMEERSMQNRVIYPILLYPKITLFLFVCSPTLCSTYDSYTVVLFVVCSSNLGERELMAEDNVRLHFLVHLVLRYLLYF